MVYIKSLLLLILLMILYQDLRYQAVSWIFFLLGFALILYNSIAESKGIDLLIHISINTFFVLFQMCIIYLFSWVKFKRRKNIFKSVFGLGDLLFLIMVIPLFSPFKFVVFFLCSSLFTLLTYLLLKALKLYKKERVPLAGLQSLFLIFVLISQFFIKFNFYNDFLIIDKLNIL